MIVMSKFLDQEDYIKKSYKKTVTRQRISLFASQKRVLIGVFNKIKYPDKNLMFKLHQDLYIPLKNIGIWFQNRRARDHEL